MEEKSRHGQEEPTIRESSQTMATEQKPTLWKWRL